MKTIKISDYEQALLLNMIDSWKGSGSGRTTRALNSLKKKVEAKQ